MYARIPGDDRVFGVGAGVKSSFQKTVDDFRDKRMLRVDAEHVSKLTLTNSKNAGADSLEFARNGADWQIAKPRVMRADTYSVEDLIRARRGQLRFGGRFGQRQWQGKPRRHNFAKPFAVLTAIDPAGEHRLTVIEEKTAAPPAAKSAAKKGTPDDPGSFIYYAKTTDAPGVYKLAQPSTASLSKPVEGYRNGRLFELSLNDPDKIELRDGNARLVIDKKTDAAKKKNSGSTARCK